METILDQASRHFRDGQPADALRLALVAHEAAPRDSRAAALAAAASHALGRSEDGMRWFRAAIALDPVDPELGCGLAACMFELKLCKAARAILETLLHAHPTHILAWCNLALACEADGDPAAAERALERATGLAPGDASVLHTRAAYALRAGRVSAALQIAESASAGAETRPETFHLLLEAALAARQPATAITAAARILAVEPGDALARRGLAAARAMQGDLEQATVELARLPAELRVGLDARLFFLTTGAEALRYCDWNGLPAWLGAAAALASDETVRLESAETPFHALAAGLDATQCRALFNAHVRELRTLHAPLKWPRPKRESRARLRIGYLGAGFGEHPSAMLTAPLMAAHDRARFEVFAYALTGHDGSRWRTECTENADVFRNVAHFSAQECAGLILYDDIDVLVDLTGLLENGRPGVHLHRPARSHLLVFGTPALFDLPGVDAMLGDAVVFDPETPGARLPGCYMPIDPRWAAWARHGVAPTRGECGLPEDVPVFCCFNNAYKLEPGVFRAWMRILDHCPDAVLWLLEAGSPVRDNLRGQAARMGVDPARLIFAPRQTLPNHLKRMRLADAFLDTFHYGAHVTGVQALAAGLPLLTICGDRFAARVGASALIHAGLADMVATDVDDYVERAVQFCRRTPAALRWRARVEAAFSEACCETRFTQHVRSLENIYENAFLQSTGKS